MTTIGTRLHAAIDILAYYASNPKAVAALDVLKQMQAFPTFVMDKELQALFDDVSLQHSVQAMFEAGVAKLPYPALMMELWGRQDWRYFLVIEEGKSPTHIRVTAMEYIRTANNTFGVVPSPLIADLSYVTEGTPDGKPAWNCEWQDDKELNRKDMIFHILAAVNLAFVMSHMGELDREVIEAPAKLNKSRAAHSKSSVHNHVIVRIGHVYDREGNKVKLTDVHRRSMTIHMRAGHTKHQPHGQPWIDEHPEEAAKPQNTATHHIVWIAPVLVNYKDGSELPLPKPRVVRL